MQVTCESCNARYKLDSSRFSGRSARITCPRCQHVFVVEKDEEEVSASSGAEGGSAEIAAPAPKTKQYDVDELDFRKVGIKAWKVKVKIGLVYDFSDYKTLAKYISDGRVTTADKISHDGKEWTEIGTIPDLAQHFVDVYLQEEQGQKQKNMPEVAGVGEFDGDEPTDIFGLKQAEAAKAEIAASKAASKAPQQSSSKSRVAKKPKPAAGPGMGVDDELMRMAQNLSEDLSTGDLSGDTPPRFVDPFEQMKRKKRAASGASSASAGSESVPADEDGAGIAKPIVFILVAVVVLAAGTFAYSEMMVDDEVVPDVVTVSAEGAEEATSGDEMGSSTAVYIPPTTGEEGAGEEEDPEYNSFSTGREEEEPTILQPACVSRGDCGQNGPSGQVNLPTPTSGAESGSGRALFDTAMVQRSSNRRTAIESLNGALALEPGNAEYLLWRAELRIFASASHEECGGTETAGLQDLGDVNGFAAEVAYLRGMHEYWCGNQDMATVQSNLERALGSSISDWSSRARSELDTL